MAAICGVCWTLTTEAVCPACFAIVDPCLFDQAELVADSSCFEGSCAHPMCIAERTEYAERGLV
jgi:hypothetical protein